MKFRRVILALPVLAYLIAPSLAADQNCRALQNAGVALQNGQLFYSDSGAWKPFTSFSDLNLKAPKRISFVYVIRPLLGGDRAGVVAIKSGVEGVTTVRDASVGKVRLVRHDDVYDSICEIPRPFGKKTVRSKAYDEFHDFGLQDTRSLRLDRDAIDLFHIEYEKQKTCVRSDAVRDLSGQFDARNNRSQFSFSTYIVDAGMDRPLVVAFKNFFRTASASSEGIARQRAEIKHYQTSDNIACVPFLLKVSNSGQFLRVNDLEGIKLIPPFPSESRWGQ